MDGFEKMGVYLLHCLVQDGLTNWGISVALPGSRLYERINFEPYRERFCVKIGTAQLKAAFCDTEINLYMEKAKNRITMNISPPHGVGFLRGHFLCPSIPLPPFFFFFIQTSYIIERWGKEHSTNLCEKISGY